MATKILSLSGMKDVQLCNLMGRLAQTVPGVTSANANFLAQKLTLEIEGRPVADTVADVTDVLQSHFPMVELKWLDVGSRPEPAAPKKSSMDDFWEEHFWTEERPGEDGETAREEKKEKEKKDEKPSKPPKEKKEKKPKEKRPPQFRLSIPPEFLFLLCGFLLSCCLFGIACAAGYIPVLQYILLGLSFLISAVSIFRFHAAGAAYRTASFLTLASAVILFFSAGIYAMIPVLICHAGMALLFWLRMSLNFEIDNMLNIRPKKVLRIHDGQMERVPTKSILPGDSLLIGPGTVFFDGIVREGSGKLDRSLLTGTTGLLPVGQGSVVHCGDILQSGSITIDVTGLQEITMAAKMRRVLFENAPEKQERQPFSRKTVLTLSLLEALLAVLAVILTALGVIPSENWFVSGAAILLACCPCGVFEAARLIRMSGLAREVRGGVLISGEKGLIDLARVKRVAVGYAGILTEGDFQVTGVEPVGELPGEELLLIAAAAVSSNTHPISMAIQQKYLAVSGMEGLPYDRIALPERTEGCGGRAMFDRQLCMAGRYALLQQAGIELPAEVDSGEACVYVSLRNEYIGRILLSDSLKKGAEGIGARLHQASIEWVCLLSGYDGSLERLAKETLGADEAISGLSEREKRQRLELLASQAKLDGKPLLYIGDGAEASLFDCPCKHLVMGTQYLELTLGISSAAIPSALPERVPQVIQTCKRAQMASGAFLLLFFVVKYLLFLALMLGGLPAWSIVLVNMLLSASYNGFALFLSRSGVSPAQETPEITAEVPPPPAGEADLEEEPSPAQTEEDTAPMP